MQSKSNNLRVVEDGKLVAFVLENHKLTMPSVLRQKMMNTGTSATALI